MTSEQKTQDQAHHAVNGGRVAREPLHDNIRRKANTLNRSIGCSLRSRARVSSRVIAQMELWQRDSTPMALGGDFNVIPEEIDCDKALLDATRSSNPSRALV